MTGLTVTPTEIFREGEFDLAFDCKPERFLKSGEQPIEFTADGALFNQTLQDAKPMLRVYGDIGIGSRTMTISDTTDYTDIDCESMDAYYEAENRNSNISGDFPILEPGENGVTLGSGITKLIITPRWWIL